MAAQSYHHGDLKAELIEQGLKLLDAEGYERFSLRKLAKRCGVSQTAPYRHFHSKDDLIGAITGQALAEFAHHLQTAVQQHPGSSKQQLTEMGMAYIRFFAAKPEYLRLLFFTNIQLRRRFYGDARVQKNNNTFQILYDATARYVAENPGESITQDELILYCWGLVHGISTLLASGEINNNEQTLAQAEKIVRGLL